MCQTSNEIITLQHLDIATWHAPLKARLCYILDTDMNKTFFVRSACISLAVPACILKADWYGPTEQFLQ